LNHETLLLNNLKHLNLTTETKCQLVYAFVGSILSYGCEVWDFGKNKELAMRVCMVNWGGTHCILIDLFLLLNTWVN